MQSVECAVIAAAGLGSRLGHGLPKCMLELGGQTLLTRLIESLRKHVACIHVVVGYREELVISLCANLHRDVVIVRNPDFRWTNTVQSMALGARGCNGKTLFLDGDLIIEPNSLTDFMIAADQYPVLAAITPSRSENPVNVELDNIAPNRRLIRRFTRAPGSAFEWANVVSGPARMLDGASGYVYEALQAIPDLCAHELDLREIDTASDLAEAKRFANKLDGALFHD